MTAVSTARATPLGIALAALVAATPSCDDRAPGTGGAGSASSPSASSSTGSTASSSSASKSSSGTGVLVASCGGPNALPCEDGFFCDWKSDLCNGDDLFGACTPLPATCDPTDEPVCACNGTTYANACEAEKAGWDRSNVAACPAPPGKFGCGWRFCDEGEYCEKTLRTGNGADDYVCRALPVGCGAQPDCTCLDQAPCGSDCMKDFTQHLVVTCQP